MTFPLLLCSLIAMTSGLHFGRSFLTAHMRGGNLLIPALAHMAISSTLMVVSVLVDVSQANMLWMVVATASMAGLALGALLPAQQLVPLRAGLPAAGPVESAPAQPVQNAHAA